MSGRTSWYPSDAAEHDRELNVELGDEFGPAGPLVMRVMKDFAGQQSLTTGGGVRTGFRVLAKKCFIDRDQARAIIERAAEIRALDELVIDDDGRRFSCRISGWEADFKRGKGTLKKASQRAGDTDPEAPSEEPDTSPEDGDVSPSGGDTSTDCPPTGHNTTGQDTSSLREEEHTAGARAESSGGRGPSLKVVGSSSASESAAPKVKHGGKAVPAERLALAEAIVADFNAQAGTGYGAFKASGQPSDNLSRVLTAIADWPAITAEVAHRMVAAQLAGQHWWLPKKVHLGHVFSSGVVEGLLEQATNPTSATGQRAPLPRNPKFDHIGRKSA